MKKGTRLEALTPTGPRWRVHSHQGWAGNPCGRPSEDRLMGLSWRQVMPSLESGQVPKLPGEDEARAPGTSPGLTLDTTNGPTRLWDQPASVPRMTGLALGCSIPTAEHKSVPRDSGQRPQQAHSHVLPACPVSEPFAHQGLCQPAPGHTVPRLSPEPAGRTLAALGSCPGPTLGQEQTGEELLEAEQGIHPPRIFPDPPPPSIVFCQGPVCLVTAPPGGTIWKGAESQAWHEHWEVRT